MNFTWFLIFNLSEFPEELVSKTFTKNISGVGLSDFLVSRGELISVYYDGVLLPIQFETKNPFIGLGNQYAVYQDAEENIYFGFAVEE